MHTTLFLADIVLHITGYKVYVHDISNNRNQIDEIAVG